MFEQNKVKKAFEFLLESSFTVQAISSDCIIYKLGVLSLEVHFSSDYRDSHFYIAVNLNGVRQNLLDTNVFNKYERERCNKELEYLKNMNLEQHCAFFADLIKNKMKEIIMLERT